MTHPQDALKAVVDRCIAQGSPVVTELRPLYTIASEIRRDWRPVNYAAKPYLDAMADCESIGGTYGADSAKSIVLYFLANAGTWRGDTARRVKAELKKMAGIK